MAKVDQFRNRFTKLYHAWQKGILTGFKGTQAVAVATGVYGSDADIGYLKSFALVTWLFGAELQDAAIIFSNSECLLIFASQDQAVLSPLASKAAGDLPRVTVLAANDDSVASTVSRVVGDYKSVSVLTKELSSQKGASAKLVVELAKLNPVNVGPALATVFAVKDSEEEKRIKKAAYLSAHVMKFSLTEKIEKTIDQDRKMSHAELSELAEDAIIHPNKVKLGAFNAEWCDPCYPPIIQSADSKTADRKFDLRPSAESSEENLAHGCVIVSIGARYNFYCSNVSRTLLIAPSKVQEAVYGVALRAQDAAIKALVPDAPLKNAYAAAVKVLKSGRKECSEKGLDIPDLVASLSKNVGFGMGIEFRDSGFVLNAKSDVKVEQNMVFNVSIGIQNISDDESGIYSVLLGDTVLVREENRGPDIFTAGSRKDFKHISYAISADDDDDEADDPGLDDVVVDEAHGNGRSGKRKSNGHQETERALSKIADGPRGRRRGAAEAAELAEAEEEQQRRRKHQDALAQKMLDRGLSRLKGGNILTVDDAKATEKKLLDEYRAYSSSKDFPPMKPRCIVVDMDHEAIIVPINGIPVPFHISTLKNATKSDEGQYSYLRVNFHTPQATVSKGLGRPDNSPKFPGFAVEEGSSIAFIKEFTFRSSNPLNLNDCLRKIKELRKRATEKVTHALEKKTLVEQQTLVIERGRSTLSLSDVSVRPPMAKGKNNVGVLEAHQNGFRYRCRSGNIDIIYSNIRNAFFQEANKELLSVVHFHLKNEIMVGAKKAKDVQFYVQVMEAVVKLNEGRRRQFDRDEFEEEQQERELRNRTNKSFLKFTKEVEDRYGLEFDLPYRQLQFIGAPKSVAVTLLPTVSCIVSLTEWPPFVLNLEDVEVSYFERVNFQLRMFDMVFVMKGFENDPVATGRAAKDYWLRISSIPVSELTPLKRYLDEQNIKYYEGKASLQWNEVLKNIRSDLDAFYNEGGWNFLSADGPPDEEGDHSDGSEESMDGDVEFEPEAEDAYESGSESSDSDSDASDAVRELEGDSDEGEDALSSGEEGITWEEMDRQAYRDDMRKERGSDDEDRHKRRGGNANSARSRGGGRSGRATARKDSGGRSGRAPAKSSARSPASRKRSRR